MYHRISVFRTNAQWIMKVDAHLISCPNTYVYGDFEFRLWFSPDTGKPVLFVRRISTDKMLPLREHTAKKPAQIGLQIMEDQTSYIEIVDY